MTFLFQVPDQDIAKVMELGFKADDAVAALKQYNGNVEQAIDSLLRQGTRGQGRQVGGPNRQASFESDRGDRGRGRRERKEENGPGESESF